VALKLLELHVERNREAYGRGREQVADELHPAKPAYDIINPVAAGINMILSMPVRNIVVSLTTRT